MIIVPARNENGSFVPCDVSFGSFGNNYLFLFPKADDVPGEGNS